MRTPPLSFWSSFSVPADPTGEGLLPRVWETFLFFSFLPGVQVPSHFLVFVFFPPFILPGYVELFLVLQVFEVFCLCSVGVLGRIVPFVDVSLMHLWEEVTFSSYSSTLLIPPSESSYLWWGILTKHKEVAYWHWTAYVQISTLHLSSNLSYSGLPVRSKWDYICKAFHLVLDQH